MTATEFIKKAKMLVAEECGYTFNWVQPVWFGYILRNMKALLMVPGEPLYFEVTYNAGKNQIYIDRYEKSENKEIQL